MRLKICNGKRIVHVLIFLFILSLLLIPQKLYVTNGKNSDIKRTFYAEGKLYINTLTRNNMHNVEENITRRKAAINFIAGLQMKDGGFVFKLDSPEEEETSNLQGYDAIRALVFLHGLDAINRESLLEFIAKRQLKDGSVAGGLVYTHEKPDIATAYGVVYVLAQLNALDAINKTALLNWVLDCYHPEDGRFTLRSKSEYPEIYRDDYYILNTIFGVLTLYWMHELDKINLEKTIDYIMSCYRSDGGFSGSPHDSRSSYSSTEWCIRALYLLNALDRIKKEKTISYVLQFYNATTQTFVFPGLPLGRAYSGTVMLGMLHATDRINTTKVVELVLSCQSNLHGGFTFTPDKNDTKGYKENVRATSMAVEMLAAVNAIDRLDVPFAILYKPEWYGKPYIPHDATESNTNSHDSRIDPIAVAGNLLIFGLSIGIFSVIYQRYEKKKRLKKLKRIKARGRYRR